VWSCFRRIRSLSLPSLPLRAIILTKASSDKNDEMFESVFVLVDLARGCTGRANRSDENLTFSSFPLVHCWSSWISLVTSSNGGFDRHFRTLDFKVVSATRTDSRGFRIHSSFRSCGVRTPSFLSFLFTDYFGCLWLSWLHRRYSLLMSDAFGCVGCEWRWLLLVTVWASSLEFRILLLLRQF
jgi:hypothetical protein